MVLGFPSESTLVQMFGYVTDDDRARWDKSKQASDERMSGAHKGLTARGLASQSAEPALGMAEKSLNAQIQGEQMALRRDAKRDGEVEVTEKRTFRRPITEDDDRRPSGGDDREMGF